jgi:hypothetical protein
MIITELDLTNRWSQPLKIFQSEPACQSSDKPSLQTDER